MSQLKIAKMKETILADLKRIGRTELLILDDFAMQTFDSQARGIVMDIIEDRHQTIYCHYLANAGKRMVRRHRRENHCRCYIGQAGTSRFEGRTVRRVNQKKAKKK